MKKKFVAIGVLGLAIFALSNVEAKADETEVDLTKFGNENVRFCSQCKLKLPKELQYKKYPYYVESSFVYDDEGNFIGLSKIEDALKNAGITDYDIDIKNDSNNDGTLSFNVKTNDRNKNYIPLVLFHIEGVEGSSSNEYVDNKVQSTDGYASCYKRAHAGALAKLKAYYDDTKYSYSYSETDYDNGTYSMYTNEDTYEVNVCLQATDVEQKETGAGSTEEENDE